jgi:hypothetical protein
MKLFETVSNMKPFSLIFPLLAVVLVSCGKTSTTESQSASLTNTQGSLAQSPSNLHDETASKANGDPLDRPIFRAFTSEEIKDMQSQGVDANQFLGGMALLYPKGWDNPDTSQQLKLIERNVLGSWRMWNQTAGEVGYNETTLSFLPDGKMNYLFTEISYLASIPAIQNTATMPTHVSYADNPTTQSHVFAGTWKLTDGYISYDLTNFVNTAEKVVSLTQKRLTCISGVSGQKYVMYRVSVETP